MTLRPMTLALVLLGLGAVAASAPTAAAYGPWTRNISYQSQHDLFYNYSKGRTRAAQRRRCTFRRALCLCTWATRTRRTSRSCRTR